VGFFVIFFVDFVMNVFLASFVVCLFVECFYGKITFLQAVRHFITRFMGMSFVLWKVVQECGVNF